MASVTLLPLLRPGQGVFRAEGERETEGNVTRTWSNEGSEGASGDSRREGGG